MSNSRQITERGRLLLPALLEVKQQDLSRDKATLPKTFTSRLFVKPSFKTLRRVGADSTRFGYKQEMKSENVSQLGGSLDNIARVPPNQSLTVIMGRGNHTQRESGFKSGQTSGAHSRNSSQTIFMLKPQSKPPLFHGKQTIHSRYPSINFSITGTHNPATLVSPKHPGPSNSKLLCKVRPCPRQNLRVSHKPFLDMPIEELQQVPPTIIVPELLTKAEKIKQAEKKKAEKPPSLKKSLVGLRYKKKIMTRSDMRTGVESEALTGKQDKAEWLLKDSITRQLFNSIQSANN